MVIFECAPGLVVEWKGQSFIPDPTTGHLLVTIPALAAHLRELASPHVRELVKQTKSTEERKEDSHAESSQLRRVERRGLVGRGQGEGERGAGGTDVRRSPGPEEGQGHWPERSEHLLQPQGKVVRPKRQPKNGGGA